MRLRYVFLDYYPLLVLVALLGISTWGMNRLVRASCYAAWQDSEFSVRWSVLADCQISKNGLVWIPAENYREIQ
jgi:hypothetical protein